MTENTREGEAEVEERGKVSTSAFGAGVKRCSNGITFTPLSLISPSSLSLSLNTLYLITRKHTSLAPTPLSPLKNSERERERQRETRRKEERERGRGGC